MEDDGTHGKARRLSCKWEEDEILPALLSMEALQKRRVQHSYHQRRNWEENKKQRSVEKKANKKVQMKKVKALPDEQEKKSHTNQNRRDPTFSIFSVVYECRQTCQRDQKVWDSFVLAWYLQKRCFYLVYFQKMERGEGNYPQIDRLQPKNISSQATASQIHLQSSGNIHTRPTASLMKSWKKGSF